MHTPHTLHRPLMPLQVAVCKMPKHSKDDADLFSTVNKQKGKGGSGYGPGGGDYPSGGGDYPSGGGDYPGGGGQGQGCMGLKSKKKCLRVSRSTPGLLRAVLATVCTQRRGWMG